MASVSSSSTSVGLAALKSAAARAASVAASSGRATRFVHINMQPRPVNVAESREVLRLLKRFGEVVMFRHLKHDVRTSKTNVLVAAFRTEDEASTLLSASPLRFTLEPVAEEKNFIDSIFAEDDKPLPRPPSVESLNTSESEPTAPDASSSSENDRPSAEGPEDSLPTPSAGAKRFILTADPAFVNMRDLVNSSPFYGSYHIAPSAAQSDLADRVPCIGISDIDIRLPPRPSRFVSRTIVKAQKMGVRSLIDSEVGSEASLPGQGGQRDG